MIIRIYGAQGMVVIEKGVEYPFPIILETDQKVTFDIGEELSVTLDYLTPNWEFQISNNIDPDERKWDIRLKPYTVASLLLEVTCPKETQVKHTIWRD